jgi:hypothetical protein
MKKKRSKEEEKMTKTHHNQTMDGDNKQEKTKQRTNLDDLGVREYEHNGLILGSGKHQHLFDINVPRVHVISTRNFNGRTLILAHNVSCQTCQGLTAGSTNTHKQGIAC